MALCMHHLLFFLGLFEWLNSIQVSFFLSWSSSFSFANVVCCHSRDTLRIWVNYFIKKPRNFVCPIMNFIATSTHKSNVARTCQTAKYISIIDSGVLWGKFRFFLIFLTKTHEKSLQRPFSPTDEKIKSFSSILVQMVHVLLAEIRQSNLAIYALFNF